MRYCPDCGTGHECAAEQAERLNSEVEIERLRTKRDIAVAEINARADVKTSAAYADAHLARAEGEADGMREVVDAVTGGGEGEGEGEGEPAPLIVDGAPAEAEPEPPLAVEPPPEPGPSPEPEASGGGWWDSYR